METSGSVAVEQGRPFTWRVALVLVVALGAAGVVIWLRAGAANWHLPTLFAVAALAIIGDLTAVEAASGKLQISGTGLGLIICAVLLGGAPAAIVGVVTAAISSVRWRNSVGGFLINLVAYAWFPLASGVVFHAISHWLGLTQRAPAYFFLVLPTFIFGILVSFVIVTAYSSYVRRGRLIPALGETVMPILAAELFSAVLVTTAVFFVVKTGTVGIIVLAAVLVIFQYLVGELLKSKQRAEELRRKATTDELTGLANRERFSAVVGETILDAQKTDERFAILLVDLDHFKEINDTLGHHYGDVVLRDLGPRLADVVGPNGVVARLGGDEFALLPSERTDVETRLEQMVKAVLECVQRPIVVDDLSLEVGASVGISRYPLDGDDVHALLRRADVAMYSAKEEHSDYKLYEARLDRHSRRRLTVLSDFRRALDSGEFVLHFQPVVDIPGARACSAESLVRWEHPELGLIPPNDFIPIAEQSGLIGPLTRYVLERAVAECRRWRDNGRELGVAVNLTVRDLLDRQLPTRITHLLDTYSLPADALQLEITESMIMSDPERALSTVTQLRELGVKISVDDFGTGYSSLANLKQLPVNELKIDRTFISSMLRDQSDLIIVRSTINLGHELRLKVVAEGVEDDLTLKRLANLGCDLAQGYHLSRPLPGDAFVDWLDHEVGMAERPQLTVIEDQPERRNQLRG